MKTASTNIEVQRGGVQAETTFTIKATSKAFDILSSGLYSDKIRAIVRELSCNAHDSHVAAGKAALPIEVKLPTYLDQTFYVKDFGLGLSDEDVNQLYTTYFESTKTNSDDFIGQLGLGSKSPFSYASTFTVESRFNGVKSVYTCFKNESGLPAISKMGEAKTDEPNGVTVALSVKRDDIDKFNDAARKTFMYFNPVPKVLGNAGFTPYSLKHTIKGDKWMIRETEYNARMQKAHVVQGFVPYPIDVSLLSERGLSKTATKLANTNLDLYVDIGQVEVAASREALSYDVRTIQNLIAVLEKAAVEIRTSFQAEFDQCKTGWEAAQTLARFQESDSREFREIFESMDNTKPFSWNGAPVKADVKLNLGTIKNTTIRMMHMTYRDKVSVSGSWTPDNTTKEVEYNIARHGVQVLVDTEAKGHNDLVSKFINMVSAKGRNKPHVLLISPVSKKSFDQQEVNLIVRQLGYPPVVKSSDIGINRGGTQPTYYKQRSVEEKLLWTGFPESTNSRGSKYTRDTFSRLCWSKRTITLEDGGFFVDLDRFTATKNGVALTNLDNIIETAISLGLVADGVQVYGMSERDKKHIKDIPEWIDFIDHVTKEFNNVNVNGSLYDRCVIEQVKQELGSSVRKLFVSDWLQVAALLNEGKFKTYMFSLYTMDNTAPKVSVQHVLSFANNLSLTTGIPARVKTLITEWNNLLKNYSMLSIINWNAVDYSNYKTVIDYINMMDPVKP